MVCLLLPDDRKQTLTNCVSPASSFTLCFYIRFFPGIGVGTAFFDWPALSNSLDAWLLSLTRFVPSWYSGVGNLMLLDELLDIVQLLLRLLHLPADLVELWASTPALQCIFALLFLC